MAKQAGRAGACCLTACITVTALLSPAFPIILCQGYLLNSCVKTSMLYTSVVEAHHDFAGQSAVESILG